MIALIFGILVGILLTKIDWVEEKRDYYFEILKEKWNDFRER